MLLTVLFAKRAIPTGVAFVVEGIVMQKGFVAEINVNQAS